jgi:YrbI family 3-deoxy-D-manno-octulosonate 8-phosphate phosphatase
MADSNRTWAIIPARGGSKAIPGKNLALVQGRSLVRRAVEAARHAAGVERVIVSTDALDIAAEGTRAGAEIVMRPAEISGDTALSEDVLLHALDTLAQRGETLPDLLCFVQCTSPFVSAGDIDGVIGLLLSTASDTALTVARSHGFLWRAEGDVSATGVNHDKATRPRRQDRKPEFLETGAVYVMRVPGFLTARHRFFGKTALYEVPASRAWEIDEPADLAAVRALAPLIDPEAGSLGMPQPLGGIVFDFDGVFTDNRVVQHQDGSEAVICSRADGLGIEMLRDAGVAMAVLSKERNPVVAARCRKLRLPCRQGIDDKAAEFIALAGEFGVDPRQLIYAGNDVNDLPPMRLAGLSVAVGDAVAAVKAEAGYVLSAPGGRGAVRELADLVLAALSRRQASGSEV